MSVRVNIIRILWLYQVPFLLTLTSCTKSKPYSYTLDHIVSHHHHPVILYPTNENNPLPTYSWPTPTTPIISPYSFHCQGSSSPLTCPLGEIYDCDGLRHSISKGFPIHPTIIALTRILNRHFPLSILEGYCCAKHLRFLEYSGQHRSKKHLTGEAAILVLRGTISPGEIATILNTHTQEKLSIYSDQLVTEGWAIFFNYRDQQTLLTLEVTSLES